jgi:hypothetical protein
MRMRVLAVSGALLLLPTLCTAPYPATGVTAEMPFSFLAGEKSLPAGTCRFAEGGMEDEPKVTNVKTGESVMVQIFTRIAPHGDPEVIFDKVGDEHHLSEIYIPGMDGFLFKGAPVKHTHVRARGGE